MIFNALERRQNTFEKRRPQEEVCCRISREHQFGQNQNIRFEGFSLIDDRADFRCVFHRLSRMHPRRTGRSFNEPCGVLTDLHNHSFSYTSCRGAIFPTTSQRILIMP